MNDNACKKQPEIRFQYFHMFSSNLYSKTNHIKFRGTTSVRKYGNQRHSMTINA